MGHLMYYEWDTQKDFDLWHNNLCQQLNYPEINEQGLILTDAYTKPYTVEGKVIAWVENEHSEGLQITELRLPQWTEEQSL